MPNPYFAVPAYKLSLALKLVSQAASSSSTLPILSGIHVSWPAAGALSIEATDLETGICTSISYSDVLDYGGNGAFVAPCKYILDLVQHIPDYRVHIELDTEKQQITVTSGKFRSSMAVLNAADYPKIQLPDNPTTITMTHAQLQKLIDNVAFAAAKKSEHEFLKAVRCEFGPTHTTFVATDAYRMAIYEQPAQPGQVDKPIVVLVPASFLMMVAKRLTTDGELSVQISNSRIAINVDGNTYVGRLIGGRYPNYDQIIPTAFPTTLEVKRESMLNAMQRASLFAKSGVRLQITDNAVTVIGRADQIGETVEEIPAEQHGDDIAVFVNQGYLVDVLQLLSDYERITLKLSGPTSAMLIDGQREDGGRYLHVIMPRNS